MFIEIGPPKFYTGRLIESDSFEYTIHEITQFAKKISEMGIIDERFGTLEVLYKDGLIK